MIILRVYRGVTSHFHIRLTEWVMVWPGIMLWFGLQLDPNMFGKSPSFTYIAAWGNEGQWSAVIGACAVCRLAALTINGTFKGFAFSPHIRAGASVIGVGMWSQVSLGFLMAFLFAGGAFSGVIGWSTLVLLELVNVYRSFRDVGRNAR